MSQRREGTNRLYVTLLVGLVVFVAALLRFGIGDSYQKIIPFSAGPSAPCCSFRGMLSFATTDNLMRGNS